MDLKFLKKIYKDVDNLSVIENCSLTYASCKKCTQECPAREMIVKRFERVVGWVNEDGRINKTNPNPGKKYRRRVLGVKREWGREKRERERE